MFGSSDTGFLRNVGYPGNRRISYDGQFHRIHAWYLRKSKTYS